MGRVGRVSQASSSGCGLEKGVALEWVVVVGVVLGWAVLVGVISM